MKRIKRQRAKERNERRTPQLENYASMSNDEQVFELAIADYIRKVGITTNEMLINPFKTRTIADSYFRAYQLASSKLARQISDSGCHAGDEKLFTMCSMLLNMALRATVILEMNYTIQQVMDLDPQEKAKTVQAARYVVEHA